jgi:predicted metal-binding membrane protein
VTGAAVQRRAFYAGGLGLAALAWTALALWAASPWARYLDHGGLAPATLLGALCGPPGEASLYVAGWTLMLAAMMLPTTLPVLWLLARVAARRHAPGPLVAAAALGYLAAWAAFAVAAHLADEGLRLAARGVPWLAFNGWLVAALVLALAGAFQFSALKRRCLDRCRSPLALVLAHWRGARPFADAARLGLAHGAFCVGCCWALMLVTFAVGTGNLGWMLLLGLVMAAEKNLPRGRALGAAAGVGLLLAAGALLVLHLPGAA